MKKKIFILFLIGMLITSSFITQATQSRDEEISNSPLKVKITTIDISQPKFVQNNNFITIELEESESYLSTSGKPMLPVITRTYSFPAGTRIDDVSVDMTWNQLTLDQKITPTPLFIPYSIELSEEVLEEKQIDETVYESTIFYPDFPYQIRIGSGIEDGEQVIFVNIQCYPQYAPARDLVKIPKNIEIEINYENPTIPQFTQDEYDLLIITHPIFEEDLQPLVDHKNSIGMRTIMETTDNIYANYQGVADWEEIKLFIADAIVDYGIEFVLLAGGHKGQTHDWYIPDFRSHNWDPEDEYDPPWDQTYSADLYFADVFSYNEFHIIEFDDWDTNENGIYAEGPNSSTGTDNPDFYPNVCLGRLPFRYTWEVPIAVNKIIDYENNARDSWYKHGVIAGGDGFPTERYPDSATPGIYEGEIVGDIFADLLEQKGFTTTKCYCSNDGDIYVEDAKDVYDVISQGAGWVHLTGHASPFLLGSYHPNVLPLIPFYTNFNIRLFDNAGKLPFMINEGCHNAQFDVTTQELIEGFITEDPLFWVKFSRDEWVHHDSSSWFVLQEEGGAIAVIGNTALGSGGLNDGCTEFVGGWIMLRFAEAYAIDGMEYTGTVWNKGITEYINYYPVAPSNVQYGFDIQGDTTGRKTIEERALIGDPSIKLGGYGTTKLNEKPKTEQPVYSVAAINVPTWSKGDSWIYRLDTIDFNLNPDPEIGRSIEMKLTMGDITMEVTDVTINTYISSIISDNIDLTIGGIFDFHVSNQPNIDIPTVTFKNVKLEGQLIVDKENLGIIELNIDITIDLIENLESITDIIDLEIPSVINTLIPIMSIPAVIEINIQCDQPLGLLEFPLENEKNWYIHENKLTVTIDGTIRSIWLRILNFINKFIPILPPELAQFLPIIDISEVLNYFNYESVYEINIPDLDLKDSFKTKLFEIWGIEIIKVPAGNYNAVHVSILEENIIMYYAEDVKNIVKLTGFLSDYIPIIEDINLELIGR
jgi:hypothetical protein